MVVAVVIAFVVGYAVIAWLLKFVENNTVYVFVAYRIALGVALLAALSIGAVSAT
jgi:undecaprenyl-diphosphatase